MKPTTSHPLILAFTSWVDEFKPGLDIGLACAWYQPSVGRLLSSDPVIKLVVDNLSAGSWILFF
jgi:hypothetical protein